MKQIATVLPDHLVNQTSIQPAQIFEEQSYSKETKEIVGAVFAKLIAIHTGWHLAAKGMNQAEWAKNYKLELCEAFELNHINSVEKLRKGVRASQASATPWLPNPHEFAKSCKLVVTAAHREFLEPTPNERKLLEQGLCTPEQNKAGIALCRAAIESNDK